LDTDCIHMLNKHPTIRSAAEIGMLAAMGLLLTLAVLFLLYLILHRYSICIRHRPSGVVKYPTSMSSTDNSDTDI